MGYWISQFIQVLIGYIFLMYLWPSVVFRKKLSGKSLTYRFAFCSTVSVLLINAVVLGLGLIHILKGWIIFCIFYGIFVLSVLKKKELRSSFLAQVRTFFSGTLGWKSLLVRLADTVRNIIVNILKWMDKKTKGRKIEYSILMVLIIFGIMYFSYGAFQCHSYGWGDMYVHHAWIYGLQEGKIFLEGVYPEAMHCFIYAMNVLFGIPVYSSLLFLGEIHTSAFLIAIYCLLREVMKSQYTVYLVLTAFLTVDVMCVDEIYGISRLQYTIPQEFGLYTEFLCAMYLIRFMRKKQNSKEKKDDLFLFTMALAASLAIHFYVTIMAFFLCGSFAVFGIRKIFQKKNFGKLIAAVIAAVVISTIPMVLAFATGTPLQGSLNWGMNIINGTDTKEGRTQVAQSINDESSMDEAARKLLESSSETGQNQSQTSSDGENVQQSTNSVQVQPKVSLKDRVQKILDEVKLVYKYGYAQLYGGTRASWLMKFTLIALVLGILNVAVYFIRFRKVPFEMYLGITFASVFFMVLYAAPFLGLPEIIAGARLCLTEQVLLLSMMAFLLTSCFSCLKKQE